MQTMSLTHDILAKIVTEFVVITKEESSDWGWDLLTRRFAQVQNLREVCHEWRHEGRHRWLDMIAPPTLKKCGKEMRIELGCLNENYRLQAWLVSLAKQRKWDLHREMCSQYCKHTGFAQEEAVKDCLQKVAQLILFE